MCRFDHVWESDCKYEVLEFEKLILLRFCDETQFKTFLNLLYTYLIEVDLEPKHLIESSDRTRKIYFNGHFAHEITSFRRIKVFLSCHYVQANEVPIFPYIYSSILGILYFPTSYEPFSSTHYDGKGICGEILFCYCIRSVDGLKRTHPHAAFIFSRVLKCHSQLIESGQLHRFRIRISAFQIYSIFFAVIQKTLVQVTLFQFRETNLKKKFFLSEDERNAIRGPVIRNVLWLKEPMKVIRSWKRTHLWTGSNKISIGC